MSPRPRHGGVRGSSLLEVTVVLVIIGGLLGALMPSYINRINRAKYEKTVRELGAIAQASVNYFVFTGVWPVVTTQLAPQFIPVAVSLSPFGKDYKIYGIGNIVTVSVLVPSGIAQNIPEGPLLVIHHQGQQDQIDISQTVPNEQTARLNYDLKYVY